MNFVIILIFVRLFVEDGIMALLFIPFQMTQLCCLYCSWGLLRVSALVFILAFSHLVVEALQLFL